jgi:hypothetical protein
VDVSLLGSTTSLCSTNTMKRTATENAFPTLSERIAVVDCFLTLVSQNLTILK